MVKSASIWPIKPYRTDSQSEPSDRFCRSSCKPVLTGVQPRRQGPHDPGRPGTFAFEYSGFAVEARPDLALVVYLPATEAVGTRLGAVIGNDQTLLTDAS